MKHYPNDRRFTPADRRALRAYLNESDTERQQLRAELALAIDELAEDLKVPGRAELLTREIIDHGARTGEDPQAIALLLTLITLLQHEAAMGR